MDPWNSRHSRVCKRFPVMPGFSYTQVPFKKIFTVYFYPHANRFLILEAATSHKKKNTSKVAGVLGNLSFTMKSRVTTLTHVLLIPKHSHSALCTICSPYTDKIYITVHVDHSASV